MDSLTLASLARAIRRRWWVAALVFASVVAADGAVTQVTPRAYLARASLLIGPSPKVEPGQLVYSVDALGRSMIVDTYANFLAADVVRSKALSSVGLEDRDGDRQVEIKTAALADSALVQVTVVAPEPVVAAAVANEVGKVGEEMMSQLYPMYELSMVTAATPPKTVYRPNVARNISIGLLLAGLLAVTCAGVLDKVLSARAVTTRER